MEGNTINSDRSKIIDDLRVTEASASENESQNSDKLGAPVKESCSKIESQKPIPNEGCSCPHSHPSIHPELAQDIQDDHEWAEAEYQKFKKAQRLRHNQRRAAEYRKKMEMEFRNSFGNYPRNSSPSSGPQNFYGNNPQNYPSPIGPRNYYGNYPKNYPSPIGPQNFNRNYPKSDPRTGFHDMYQKFATIYIRSDRQISPDDLCVISEF